MRKTLVKIALWVLRQLKASPLQMELNTEFWYRGALYHTTVTTLESRDCMRELTIQAYSRKED